tara:strand:- start:425 stop:571 length:147 start_codon:yes stop_codon:yes gene_type:complete
LQVGKKNPVNSLKKSSSPTKMMAKKGGTLNYNSSKKDFGVPSAKISLI